MSAYRHNPEVGKQTSPSGRGGREPPGEGARFRHGETVYSRPADRWRPLPESEVSYAAHTHDSPLRACELLASSPFLSGKVASSRAGESGRRRLKKPREFKPMRPHREVPSHLSRTERLSVVTTHSRYLLCRFFAVTVLLLLSPLAGFAQSRSIQLQDVTKTSGIGFVHTDGSTGRRYIIETTSTGLALFDYDGDGDDDIYFPNGLPQPPGSSTGPAPRDALYRNDGDFHFTDVTDKAGLGVDVGHGQGVTAGDYDEDGDLDLYVTNFGPNVLYRNNGDGTFNDATLFAGVACGKSVSAGCCFFDMEADGDLDLYVANYVNFSYASHVPHAQLGLPAYPSPLNYVGEPDILFCNNGDGSFRDVSIESGIAAHAGRGMGVVCADYDQDGDTDVFVANDVMENFLFQNDGRGKFTEVGLLSGVAYGPRGLPYGNMGADFGDFDNDGLLDVLVTSFRREMVALYRNSRTGLFDDVARQSGAGAPTLPHVKWGLGVVDFENDGDRDIYIACGDLDDNIELRDDTTAFMIPDILLMNVGSGKFQDVSSTSGDGLRVKLSSRGAAFGDLDGDGRVDGVVLNSRREPTLLRNLSPAGANHWLKVRLQGLVSNRNGVGGRVTITAGDLVLVDEVHSGRGYQSHFGMELHFGLGRHDRVDKIEVRWLAGGVHVVKDIRADQLVVIHQRHDGRQ
jgi:hypothetical protein